MRTPDLERNSTPSSSLLQVAGDALHALIWTIVAGLARDLLMVDVAAQIRGSGQVVDARRKSSF
jgi:hypothetical protein